MEILELRSAPGKSWLCQCHTFSQLERGTKQKGGGALQSAKGGFEGIVTPPQSQRLTRPTLWDIKERFDTQGGSSMGRQLTEGPQEFCKDGIYELEHMFVSNMEKQKILLKIDPLTWTETFHTGKGREEVLEIHDFKNGITGLFFMGDPKCLLQNQIKGIPEASQMEMEALEAEEIAVTYFEQSVLWVPGEEPIENKDFLKDSKIKEESQGPKRHIRQLTEEDLPVNDYTEHGLEFHPLWESCCPLLPAHATVVEYVSRYLGTTRTPTAIREGG
ncbi:hypothetical protein E2320_013035 [Naja naja]|nr:hypothetical protein E2320_013035 [Naja naja]